MDPILSVREIQTGDIELIANYWLEADPEYLLGMGVDLEKLPTRAGLSEMLLQQINTPLNQKASYALIWLLNGKPVGHSNVNSIEFGNSAHMHLHLWHGAYRQKGIGTELVKMSLPYFFDNLQLKVLYCEPYALNPAPNRTLEKVGFEFKKCYTTIPGSLNFEQEVNRWKMTKENFDNIRL